MAYEWDIFISYKKDYSSSIDKYSLALRKRWLSEIFLPYLVFALQGELGRDPKIFWDEQGLDTGDDYANKLIQELSRSKCLIAILSNPYFYDSEWCLREFCFMKLRFTTSREQFPNTYIFPFLFQPTNTAHPLLSDIHFSNFIKYNKVGKAFTESEDFLKFQDDISRTASELSDVIRQPPAWNDRWTTKEWRDEVDQLVSQYRQLTLDQKVSSTSVQL